MKLLAVFLFAFSSVAYGESAPEVAFERLNYDIANSDSVEARLTSLDAYFNTIERLEAEPSSKQECQAAVLRGEATQQACIPVGVFAMSGGTGGVQ